MQDEFEVTDTILSQANNAIESHRLCVNCLGRLFGKLGHGLTNEQRGIAIFQKLKINPTDEKCWLCEDIITEIPKFSDLVISELDKWDYSSFLVGTKIDNEMQAREEELWIATGVEHPELLKSELNREIGKLVEKKNNKQVNFSQPDIVAIIDTRFDYIKLQITSLYIFGRYRKLITGIPQTKWPCHVCLGKGCDHCGGKGKLYETSVEELIASEPMAVFKGVDHSFHGMGREDIDARMLGNGRPFILEIKNPKLRKFDILELEAKINSTNEGKVQVSNLRFAELKDVQKLKETQAIKTYVITIKIPDWVQGKEKLKMEVGIFTGLQIDQQTPTRVVHRRSDLVRKRKILEFVLDDWNEIEKIAKFRITAESGTYIKELVTGDNGRTKPSVASTIGAKCEVLGLDVVQIHDGEINK